MRYCVRITYTGHELAETVAEMYTTHALPVYGFVDPIETTDSAAGCGQR